MRTSARVATGVCIGIALGAAVAAVSAAPRHAAWRRLAPRWRHPILLWMPRGDPDTPPRRGRLARWLLSHVPTGLGEPVTIPGPPGAPEVPGFTYEVAGRPRPSPGILWIHGGGMISGGTFMSHGVATRLARELGAFVVTLDYRLAPEHPFPAGPEDCLAALRWLHDRADDLGIDRDRIAVGGESAGGGLAAVVAQRAHDERLPVAHQVLIYPMLDDRTALADPQGRGEFIWTPRQNERAWEWYLGHPGGTDATPTAAAAARRDDLTGLPSAWIGVGDADLFLAEDVAYAHRLAAAGVDVDLHVEPGMAHGLDFLPTAASRAFTDRWVASLRRALGVAAPSVPARSA